MSKLRLLAPCLAFALAVPVLAQDQDQDRDMQIANPNGPAPVYRVNVVERTTKAIDYRRKGGNLKVDLVGTELMPDAHGYAKVDDHTGRVKIDIDFKHLKQPQSFGPQYLTYVLWAITPEGRPQNLGEVVLKSRKDTDSNLHVTTSLQSFGMIVTAEPYFAVSRPSNVVVMENQVGPDVKASVQPITTHYETLGQTEYSVDISPDELPAGKADSDTPLDILEAQNAIAIAKATGANEYAEASLQKAQDQLTQAENAWRMKRHTAEFGTAARLAAEAAEDARLITIRRKHEEQLAAERREQQQKTDEARASAEEARLQAEREAQQRQAADQAREQAERAKQEAVAQQQQLAQQAQQAQLQAQQAEAARQQAEAQVRETRERLMRQLNTVLQTRESARGLIVNMNDVLFDTGKATLKPSARERLAKVAGIVMAYPDLHLQVEGFTDSVGGDAYNQRLSEQRADAVRQFLVSQGVPSTAVEARGFGKSEPIASNDTAIGRQLNRRVELVVSGEAIGAQTQANTGSPNLPSDNGSTPAAPAQPSAVGSPSTPR
jgi:outer membrane protein OmpA-like peptidoglycan-associated protein